ncbi:hypothetical protein [Streptomyces sp. NPDC060031]|uniref:hypothetical protein n=1 Tax=Streptomyces sp. NPDC060031 TaxID=3347043 RepID=UPI00367F0583
MTIMIERATPVEQTGSPTFETLLRTVLREQLQAHVPEGHFADTSPFLFRFPAAERGYGPHLYVADEAAFEQEGLHADAAALSLVGF